MKTTRVVLFLVIALAAIGLPACVVGSGVLRGRALRAAPFVRCPCSRPPGVARRPGGSGKSLSGGRRM